MLSSCWPRPNTHDARSTLIASDGTLLTALGRVPLGADYALGPLGNLLHRGQPVPAGAAFDAVGKLVHGGTVLHALA